MKILKKVTKYFNIMERKKYSHKLNITCGLWDAFRDFRNKFKVIHPTVNRAKYVNACYLINRKISDKIIKESFEFKTHHS